LQQFVCTTSIRATLSVLAAIDLHCQRFIAGRFGIDNELFELLQFGAGG
jgi:hypothetical protein